MQNDLPPLFTLGHSNLEWPAFVEMLERHGVSAVADVRSQPTSRLWHFNQAALEAGLREIGVGYLFLGRELGARREEPQCYDGDVAEYGRIAVLPQFGAGLARLRGAACDQRVALLCAEKEPLDCHRTILICRHLRGEFDIRHILADGGAEAHAATERRLMRQMKVTRTLFEPDLTEWDLIQQAYDARGRQIAYRAEREGAIE